MAEEIRKRLTIDQLEDVLKHDDDVAITILPNGEIVADAAGVDLGKLRPLTFRENLGGEYGHVHLQ